MSKLGYPFFVIAALLLSACGASENQPTNSTEPPATQAAAVVERPPVVIEATETFLPLVEAEATATPSSTPPPPATPTTPPTATSVPTSPIASVDVVEVIPGGLQRPTFLTNAGDSRLFVLEQAGRIRIIEDGVLLPEPFLDITNRVGSSGSEQGLLGLAFHPDYISPGGPGEGHFYVNYTDLNGDTHISRFSVISGEPNQADPGSELNYLTVDQPYPNHNGGMLAFGPDGYLYAGLGDGGLAGDPLNAGQDLGNLLGKLLRLDVDAQPDVYTIPPDNPFVGQTEAQPEIWAYGLRNPWRFSFDRLTGDLFVADVGQNMWEEINVQPAGSLGGENYGWRIMEASHCYQSGTCDQSGLVLPIFEYDHTQGCSVTGGYMYRGVDFPEMTGNYLMADYCSGIIWRLFPDGDRWQADIVLDSALIISSFGEDANGELYVTNYTQGAIYRLVPGVGSE